MKSKVIIKAYSAAINWRPSSAYVAYFYPLSCSFAILCASESFIWLYVFVLIILSHP